MSVLVPITSFNSGQVSRLALGRVDLQKLRNALEDSTNFLPLVIGPAQFRPGTEHILGVPGDAQGWFGEFIYSDTETAVMLMTSGQLQFLVDDALVARTAVSATITNGGFDSDLSGWTNSDEPGAASAWYTGGALSATGTGTNYAWLDQQITVTETGAEHALRVAVTSGIATLRVGTSAGDNTYFDVDLRPGIYSFAFEPTGNFWIRIGANTVYPTYIDSLAIEGAGTLTLPVPYTTTTDFDLIRYDQSGDVIFVACLGYQQRRIERRARDSRSWAVALYQSDDGPFQITNITSTTLTPSATSGSVTLTASRDLFKPGHVGALWSLTHPGQTETATLGALADSTGNIRVTGLAAHDTSASQRAFTVVVGSGLTGTVTLQRSLAEPGSWTDVESYTVPTSKTFDDGLDNQIIYYRLRVTAYTSGSALSSLNYTASAQTGIARIVAVTNSLTATADVLSEFGATTATSEWSEGEWSDYRGWPEAVTFHDGRLSWFPSDRVQLSVSDAFASFDPTTVGDSGPINRTLAVGGGRNGVRWALSLQRLIVGTATEEVSIRASTLDGPLTPTDFVARVCSTRGVAAVRAVKVGTYGIFVERNRQRVFELAYDFNSQDYHSKELTRLNQEICAAGIVDVAVQVQPDTRIWFVLGDGRCVVLTYEPDDDVVALTPFETQGAVERVAVLPGTDEDLVYFLVARTIGATTKRFIERLAKLSEARGGTLNKTVDSHVAYNGSSTTALALPHLPGQTVVVWADGALVPSPITLDGSGNGTLPVAASSYVAGLPYTGRIQTAKLAYGAEHGSALAQKKRVARVGLVMDDLCPAAITLGRDFDHLGELPKTYRGRPLGVNEVLSSYDAMVPFNGGYDEDARVCLQVSSPSPCTLKAMVIHMETNDDVEPPPAPRER